MSGDDAQISYSELLDHAANDDAVAFRNAAALDPSSVDRPALWYIRHPSTTRTSLQTLTPLMVAAAYGSLSVLSLILDELSLASADRSFADRATALHYAASSGSPSAIPAVKILLSHYADTDAVDKEGDLPADVIAVRPDHKDDAPVLRRLLHDGPPPPWELPALRLWTFHLGVSTMLKEETRMVAALFTED